MATPAPITYRYDSDHCSPECTTRHGASERKPDRVAQPDCTATILIIDRTRTHNCITPVPLVGTPRNRSFHGPTQSGPYGPDRFLSPDRELVEVGADGHAIRVRDYYDTVVTCPNGVVLTIEHPVIWERQPYMRPDAFEDTLPFDFGPDDTPDGWDQGARYLRREEARVARYVEEIAGEYCPPCPQTDPASLS